MSMGFRSWRLPSLSTPNINEAASTDITTSLHRNALSWSVWRDQEEGKERERESPFLGRVTPCSDSQRVGGVPYSCASNLFRTASVPDVVIGNPRGGFTSITITAQRVAKLGSSLSQETLRPSFATRPMKALPPPEPFRSRAFSTPRHTMKASSSQPDLCRQNPPVIVKTTELRQSFSAADEVAMRGPGRRRGALPLQHRHSFTEGDRNREDMEDSFTPLSSQSSYRSCVHLNIPLRSASTFVFVDKSLSVSLLELEARRATQPPLHRSTLSLRLAGSSRHRLSMDSKPTKTHKGYGRSKTALTSSNKWGDPKSCMGHSRGPLSKQWGHKVQKIASVYGVNSRADDSDTHQRDAALGSLSFRGPSPSYTGAGRRNGNADETVCSTRSNFRHRQPTFNVGPVNSGAQGRQTRSKEEGQGHGCSREVQKVTSSYQEKTCYYHSRLMVNSLDAIHRTLSLKEALELFRPDFISRSQGRVRRLEQRARRRRALQDSNPDLVQGLGEDRGGRRNCTTPDPLSDNLFKPRERSISGREMQQRSRRIYNKLPEVTRKKEEEKKRAVSQTNRLRAELFKKKLLDQILQR